MLLFRRHQLLVNAEPGFGDDADDIAQLRGSVAFDALLFRASDVMRPEKAPNRDGELHAGAGITRDQSLANCNIQNPPKNPQLERRFNLHPKTFKQLKRGNADFWIKRIDTTGYHRAQLHSASYGSLRSLTDRKHQLIMRARIV